MHVNNEQPSQIDSTPSRISDDGISDNSLSKKNSNDTLTQDRALSQ